jgi:hypothetical protein
MDGMAWCRLGFPCRPSKTTYVDSRCNYYCGLPNYIHSLTLEPSCRAVETRPLTPCFDRSRAADFVMLPDRCDSFAVLYRRHTALEAFTIESHCASFAARTPTSCIFVTLSEHAHDVA